ncbi:MAG: M48 family metalloprotease, partial [Acidobacteriota bacterium]
WFKEKLTRTDLWVYYEQESQPESRNLMTLGRNHQQTKKLVYCYLCHTKNSVKITVLIFAACWILSCVSNPVTGKKELMLFTEEREIAIGKDTDQQIRQQYGLYPDAELTSYVQKVGITMVPHTHRPQLEYHFSILDTPVANAFAVPGGYIYVTRGLLAMMNSEAELAVVLGHELGHVNARHSMRKMSQLMLVQGGLALGSAISETVADLSGMASVGIQLLFLKFSRDDERQADQLGVEYSRAGRYNPAEMIDFFQTLKAVGDLSDGHSLPGFLSTHPMYSERVENTQEMILSSDSSLAVKEGPYLKKIEGLVFGPDPRQGYVENGAFYHPQMQFVFRFPEQWSIQNTAMQVTLVSQDKKAAVILQAEKSSSGLQEYADKKTSGMAGSELLDQADLTINNLSSLQRIYRIYQEDAQELKAQITFIRKNPYIYSFTALSTTEDFNAYTSSFQSIVFSFSQLNDPKYLERSPQRIKLVESSGRDSLEDIFSRAGMDKELWTKFAILNGMQAGQIPERGRLIKVLR